MSEHKVSSVGFFGDPVFSWSQRIALLVLAFFVLLANAGYAQTISTVAGPGGFDQFGQPVFGDGAPASQAFIGAATRIAVAPDGSVFIADSRNHIVRKILPNGTMTTYAGVATLGQFGGDGGLATSAFLKEPNGLALDAAGNLYIADAGNYVIRKVAPNGIITTFIGDRNYGNSPDGSSGSTASIGTIADMAMDSSGNLYIASENFHQIRKVTPDAHIYTVAGTGTSGLSGDGSLAINANLFSPSSIAIDSTGNIFIADTGNHRIRKINSSGIISTVAGTINGYGGDNGEAASAQLSYPISVDVDAYGGLYIVDNANHRIRKVRVDSIINTIAGNGDMGYNGDGVAAGAHLNYPNDLALAPNGQIFIADTRNGRIRKISPVIPNAPIIGNAVAGHTRAWVGFTPPALDGGATIFAYTVSSSPAGGIDSQAGSSAAAHEITGLNNGTPYTFTVTATNAAGTSLPSAASISVTPNPYPGAPIFATAIGGNAQATVVFMAPGISGSGPITGYTVTSFPAGGIDTNAGSTSLSHLITGLINGVAYTFTVKAQNADGSGLASAASNSITPVTIPGAPSVGSAVAGNGQVTVSLNPPANNGGTPITSYAVVSSPAAGVDNNAGSASTSHVISGLTNGTSYTFTATVTNAVGTGPASAPSNAITPATIPNAPGISNVLAGNAQASLLLLAPSDNGGSVITGYTVTSFPAGGVDANAGSANLNRTITGLVNGTSYTFTATATNIAGTSNSSPISSSVTPATVPDAPVIGIARTGGSNGHARVAIFAPASNGGSPITSYTVSSSPAGGIDLDAGTLSQDHVITGLAIGTAYTFSAKATNAFGTSVASAQSNSFTPVYTPPILSVAHAATAEGNSGTKTLDFSISLSEPSTTLVKFNIATSNETASAGSDYVAKNLSNQTIAIGQVSYTFSVVINGDTTVEGNETFFVTLSNITGATSNTSEAQGTILTDDFNGGVITTIAGGGNGDGGPAVNAYLREGSENVAFDSAGNLYIAETYRHRIRKVTPAGIISTVAGTGEPGFTGDGGAAISAKLNRPFAVAVDVSGNLLIADSANHRIRRVTPAGIITTIAGNGADQTAGDGGSALGASLSFPSSIVAGPAANIYIVDGNRRVRKFTVGGLISTVVGNGSYEYSGDGGLAIAAGVNPYNIAVDAASNIYVTDHTNHRIRKVTSDGIIRTIAGNGVLGDSGDGGPATAANIYAPYGIGVDSIGNISFSDYLNNVIRKIDTSGKINTIAGNRGISCPVPNNQAICASVYSPYGLAVAADDSVYFAAYYGVYKIDLSGNFSKAAGGGSGEYSGGYAGDGGPAISAILNQNEGVATDTNGNVFIADTANHRIRRISSVGTISTYAGNGNVGFAGDGGSALQAAFDNPTSISTDLNGNLYVLDLGNNRIRKITTAGIVSTVAGYGQSGVGAEGISAITSPIAPVDIATDSAGNLYLAEASYGRIRKVSPGGIITTVAGNGTYGFSGDGGKATSASFRSPSGIDFDANGNMYIVDRNNFIIRRVSPSGIINTIAGIAGIPGSSGDGGLALAARLQFLFYIKTDLSGNVFIQDTSRIRKISVNGVISTYAGSGNAGMSGDGGPAIDALIAPNDITTDVIGNLYLSDRNSNRVRRVTPLVGGAIAPGAPAMSLVTAGDRSATVGIVLPLSNGGSAITGYAVTSIPAGGVDSNAGSPGLRHVVTGLTNGVEYRFQATATNSIGTGPVSGLSNAVVPLPGLSISDVSIQEGNSGALLATFIVSLTSPALSNGASFDVATADVRSTGNAASAGKDYAKNGIARYTIPAGQTSVNYTVKIVGDKLVERNEIFAVNLSNPDGTIIVDGSGTGTILNDDNPSLANIVEDSHSTSPAAGDASSSEPPVGPQNRIVAISEIQGPGLNSPLLGNNVRTRGVVTALAKNGFYIQSTAQMKDADSKSSEAVFVFTRIKPTVIKGSYISVEGKVEEVRLGEFENQLSLTQITMTTHSLISANHPLPEITVLAEQDIGPKQSQFWLERYEGMLVSMPSMKVVGPVGAIIREEKAESISNGIFYVTGAGVPRPFQEPGINSLDNAPVLRGLAPAKFDGNPETIRVDSTGLQNAKNISVDVGDYLTNLKGILSYGYGAYTVLPDPNVRILIQSQAAPKAALKPEKTEFTIGNFNLGRLFDDKDNPATKEPVLTGHAYFMRLAKSANAICSYANNPDILSVSGVENIAVLSDLASAINSQAGNVLYPKQCSRDPQYLPYLNASKSSFIANGFLISNAQVRPGVPRAQVLSMEQHGSTAKFAHLNGRTELLSANPVLLVRVRINLKNGGAENVSVISANWNPRGDEKNSEYGRGGWSSRQAYVRAKHRAQALYLAGFLQARQIAHPKENIIVLGGFSAAEFSDGYDDILGIVTGRQLGRHSVLNYVQSPVTKPLTNLTTKMPSSERYSSIQQGIAKALDHVLVNQAIIDSSFTMRTEFARINSDFGEDNFGDFSVPLRNSDHDPLILYLGVDGR